MKKITDIYPYNRNSVSHSQNSLRGIEDYLNAFFGSQAVVLSSAKVGVFMGLTFAGLKRWDHIMVPDYLCQSILNILNTSSFPVKNFDPRTKAILLFHQWGYPQDMDKVLPLAREKKLFIIEDCAHGFDSKYKGRAIGTFGDLAILSFSKILGSRIGGALISNNEQIINYAKNYRKEKAGLLEPFFNILAYQSATKSFFEGKWRSVLDIVYLKSILFPNINRKALNLLPPNLKNFKELLQERKLNYEYLKKNIKADYITVDHNNDIDVNPLCVPVFLPVDKLETVQIKLSEEKFFVEIMHFDVNRNMFDPKYVKCLALPCHQQLSMDQLELMVKIINRA